MPLFCESWEAGKLESLEARRVFQHESSGRSEERERSAGPSRERRLARYIVDLVNGCRLDVERILIFPTKIRVFRAS